MRYAFEYELLRSIPCERRLNGSDAVAVQITAVAPFDTERIRALSQLAPITACASACDREACNLGECEFSSCDTSYAKFQ